MHTALRLNMDVTTKTQRHKGLALDPERSFSLSRQTFVSLCLCGDIPAEPGPTVRNSKLKTHNS